MRFILKSSNQPTGRQALLNMVKYIPTDKILIASFSQLYDIYIYTVVTCNIMLIFTPSVQMFVRL